MEEKKKKERNRRKEGAEGGTAAAPDRALSQGNQGGRMVHLQHLYRAANSTLLHHLAYSISLTAAREDHHTQHPYPISIWRALPAGDGCRKSKRKEGQQTWKEAKEGRKKGKE